jgi:hypothetical protein
MKKIVVLLAGVMLVTANARAQGTAAAADNSNNVVVVTQAEPQKTVAVNTVEIVKQPTVVVEAAPLSVSKADQVRKAREQTEIETETKIVERLEQARIEDEKRRQEAILGTLGAGTTAPAAKEVAAPVAAAPVAAQQQPQVIVVPQASAAEAQKAPSIEEVRNAVREELSASQQTTDASNVVKAKVASEIIEKRHQPFYATGTVGIVNYDSYDIETIGALGVSVGKILNPKWSVELAGNFSTSYVDETAFVYREMDQWSVGMGTRFHIIPTSVVRPSLGFMVNYVDRTYSEPRDAGYNYPYVGELHSRAVDYGFTAGIEFLLDDNFTMGAEYRYFTNLTYAMDEEVLNTPAYRNAYGYFSPIEERDYDFWGFMIRYLW